MPGSNARALEKAKSLPADTLILSLLQGHFNVRVILMSGHRKTPVDIIGAPEDVDFAIYALSFLRETFFRCWNEFKKTAWNPDRASYYRGLRDGIHAELTAAKRRAEESYGDGDRQTDLQAELLGKEARTLKCNQCLRAKPMEHLRS
jgi:hypothetical protein